MSKSAGSHRKPRLSLMALLTLLFAVVSVSFGTIIYSADSNNKEKKQENSVFKTINLISVLSGNIFLKNSTVTPDSTFIVNNNGDSNDAAPGNGICLDSSGNCTLRAAIQEANTTEGTDEIIFGLATPTTIQLDPALTPEELVITKGVMITGPGARLLTVNGITNPGARTAESPNASSGIFNINTTTSVTTTISGMTIGNTGGRGINNAGKLNLSDVLIRGNHFGIYNSGNLNLTRALITNNSSGGIYNSASSSANISNTTITVNSSVHGGGIHSLSSDLTLNNVTISNNTAATSGGGLYYSGALSGVSIRNTIIANNTAPTGPDILSANSSTGANFISRGNNLIGISDGNIGFANGVNGDKVGTIAAPIDPLLGPLQNNGGQTNTRALATGSPARNAGNICVTNSNCGGNSPPTNLLLTDQRGTDFPRNFETGVDIGAFESFYPVPSISSLSPNNWGTDRGGFELTINGTNFVRDSVVKWNGQSKTPIFVSNTQLRVQISGSDVASAGQYAVTVTNPLPGGGASEAVNFTVANCSYSINPTFQNFTIAGGNGSINITTVNGCPWTATTTSNWITINGSSGIGTGTVNFTVAANTGLERTGIITVGGKNFTVHQESGCTYTLSPTSTTIPASGGPKSFAVTTNNGCTWNVATSDSWINITSGSSGTGNGTVQFIVAANTGPGRTGTITAAGQNFTVTQENGCSFSLSPNSANIPAGGGTNSFNVNSGAGCTWTAASNAPWITVTSGSPGSGNGTVQYTVAANTGLERTGTITVNGQTFEVTQTSGCNFALSPTSTNIPAAGGNSSFNVTSSTGCEWTAVSTASWITVTGGSPGSGNGTVNFSVAANTGPERTGTITAGGKTFTVTQANGCTFTLTPASLNITAGGGTRFFDVSSGAGCTWTAVSSVPWITVTSGSPGNGNGRVNFSVAANTGPERTGTITIDNKTFTVTQDNGCTFTINPTNQNNVPAAGGPGSFSVIASNNACTWNAVANDSWITITSGASGTGNGTVQFTIAANTGPARSGTITAGGQTFTINQNSGCTYSISPTSTSFPPAGGPGSFNITTNNQLCTWTATTTSPWITIVAPASGTGNGVVSFTVAVNISPERTGTITVGGQTFTITQGNGCAYTLSATSASIQAGGGTGSFNVNSGAGCTWTVQSNAPWITITSSNNGTGGGTVTFSVAANIGPSRSGTITAAGQTFTVNQANGCTFTLSPTSTNVSSGGATRSFAVTASSSGCTWTATANDTWINITSGASGTGNGTVNFSVAANVSPARVGTITVGNTIVSVAFTVNQDNGCTYSISPTSTGVDEIGGTRSINVMSGAGCTWTAASNDSWITITAGASGSGNGTVTLSIAATTGQERTGTVTAAGRTFTVNQISLRVTNLNDSGIGSLRRAIANANSSPDNDVINFQPSLAGTIALTSGEIRIENRGSLEIRGLGADRLKISGNNSSRIFYIDNATVTISGLHLTRGNGVGEGSFEFEKYGGAIYSNHDENQGSLKLDRVEVYFNVVALPAGGRSIGGGVYYFGGLNHSIENSTFSFNRSDFGAGFYSHGTMSIANSTFYGNVAKKLGGGMYTVADVKLRSTTITRNETTDTGHTGAGIMIEGASIDISNTIISENIGPEITYESGGFLSAGNNLIGDAPGDSSNTKGVIPYNPSDIRDVPPMLATIAMYGGTTITAALLPGSPAINAAGGFDVPTMDQRGSPRAIGGNSDIGAFEQNITISPATTVLPNATIGVFYTQSLTTLRSNNSDPFAYFEYFMVDGFLPTGLDLSQESGTISGTPTTGGNYTFIVKSVGTDLMAGAQRYTISVGCSYSINPTNQSVNAGSGSGVINVTAPSGCPWTAQSNAPWLTVTGGSSGSGNGTVNFSVAANNGSARTGTITAGGQTFTVNQASDCTFSINPTNQSVVGSGGSGSFAVTASNSNCTWNATSGITWINITSGASGTGNGTVNFSVAANTGLIARSGTITVGGQTFTINQAAAPISNRAFDFDGDGKADLAVFRPSNGSWYILGSRDGFLGVGFGIGTDKPVPADYDGDGKTDIAVYRDGIWYLLRSQDGFLGISFGQTEDIPQPGDYDGDGKADLAVFRPSNGSWYLLQSRDGFAGVGFGIGTDKPVAADYDGDGKTDIAVYRDGAWYLLQSRDGFGAVSFGIGTDIPVAADYDGDGKSDVGVFRDGVWHLLKSRDGYIGVGFGIGTDKPVAADYDGDGKMDIAVFRDGTWHILDSGQGESQSYRAVQFGEGADIPIPASLR